MIHHKIYESINDVPQDWDTLVEDDILLKTSYLKALENASPSNFSLYYITVFNNEELVAVALIQRVQLYLKDMFRETKASCFKTFLKENISKLLKGNILVVGNLTHTGQHGLFFNSEKLSKTTFYNEIFIAISEIRQRIKSKYGKSIRLVLIKDFFSEDRMIHNELFQNKKFHKVVVQPNMIFSIRENWIKNEDYIACMNKKYRARYRRAKKKLNGITCQELDEDAIKVNSKLLHQLYLNVSNNAKFNTFILPENHFYTYKTQLKDNFRVFGYYLNDELIGFYTLILNNTQLETYFLGYHTEHQYPSQLYLNMLYDMVKFAIDNKFKNIVYARTAMEIKSSVGAKPHAMVLYLKYTNSFMNAILKQTFKFMNPKKDWEERHPFN